MTELVLTHHMWSKALKAGIQGDALFLDFAKVFDRWPHKILLHKLCNFGISGSLLAWSGDHLSNRKGRVVVDGKELVEYYILCAAVVCCRPPLFFVIYTSDLPEVVGQGSTMALYTDTARRLECGPEPVTRCLI